MTSMYSSSRGNTTHHTTFEMGLEEIQTKRKALLTLETALKKRISELKELCLKEGELTGHLPIDYPLQPREPIPQIRRKINQNNNNISVMPPYSSNSRANQHSKAECIHSHASFSNAITTVLPFPSRPTSTNSTVSSNSTTSNENPISSTNFICPPPRPPRGQSLTQNGSFNKVEESKFSSTSINGYVSDDKNKITSNFQFQSPLDITNVKPLQHFNTNGNFQLNIEETKPFQMSDFYKYSSKYRQKVSESQKSTRQLQEEVLKKNPLKFSACDDQIQASVKLIEKSGQKFLEATAKAIAVNPRLAEKIQNILPNGNDHF